VPPPSHTNFDLFAIEPAEIIQKLLSLIEDQPTFLGAS
jgi:hypothetical protein